MRNNTIYNKMNVIVSLALLTQVFRAQLGSARQELRCRVPGVAQNDAEDHVYK